MYTLQGFSTVLMLIQTVVLARLLTPEHFGIVGVFLIFSAALESFTQAGLTKALIQRKNLNRDFLNTAWAVSIIRGIILFSLVFISSTIVVDFFNTPKALPVIKVLGFSMLLQGFYNPGTTYFSRDLDFFKQFLWQGGGVLANFLVSIPLAFILRNEWAIVWGMLSRTIVTLILSFYLHPSKPHFIIKYEVFKKLYKFGKWIFFSSILAFFVRQGDKIFVAKLLDTTLLGIYIMACRIAFLPQLFSKVLPKALLPAYSKFQNNPLVLKDKYIDSLKGVSIFYFPVLGGIIVFSEPFIFNILGEKWISAQLPMQILALAVGINFLMLTGPSLFNAMGKTSFNFKVNCASGIVFSIFIYPLVKTYQVEGAALCYLMMVLAMFIVWKIEIRNLIDFKFIDLRCILLPLISTIFTSILIICVAPLFNMNNISMFIGAIFFSGLIYLLIGLLIEKVTGLYFIKSFIVDIRFIITGK